MLRTLGGSSVVCLLSLVCLGELAETRGAEAIITADVYTKSHAFVKAVYPTLSGRGLVFMVAADRWRELDDSVRPLLSVTISVGERQQQGDVAPVFSGNLEFAEDGSLYSFFARSSSPLFKSRELAELGTRIRAHPEWGEREVAQAATDAAARFGPGRRAEMETHLDGQLHRIERSLGKTRRGPLVFRTDDRTPRWVFDVFIAHTGGEYTYTAIAEPFEGELMSLSRASR